MVFRIPAAHVPDTMDALWRREMPSGAYIPRWLNCHTPTGRVNALTFTMNRATDGYVRDLPPDRLIQVIHSAHGKYGPCLEYVLETADRKSTRLNSSHVAISYAVFCLKKKTITSIIHNLMYKAS